jgi:hypothetical protein
MAIEDEIINISDIDVGTEILNNDRLIIETNNGTKLLAFKDLVIGEDNITFKDKLVQGTDATGESSTRYSSVTGFNILTSDTTAGHLTKYADISGTVELGKFNYNGISKFASMSATIEQNNSSITDLNANLTSIYNRLKNTDSADLNTVTITTKPVNFKLTTGNDVYPDTKGVGFDTKDLDPQVTNPAVDLEINPFKITYPDDGSFSTCWMLFMVDLISNQDANAEVYLNVNNDTIATTEFSRKGRTGRAYASLQTIHYIPAGAVVTLLMSRRETIVLGSNFAGVKIS